MVGENKHALMYSMSIYKIKFFFFNIFLSSYIFWNTCSIHWAALILNRKVSEVSDPGLLWKPDTEGAINYTDNVEHVYQTERF